MARGRDGDGALRDCRVDRGPRRGPCPQRHSKPAGARTRAGRGEAGRRQLADRESRHRGARRHRAHPPRRARAAGRRGDRGPQRHRPGAGHGREHPGRQDHRRPRLRGHHQPDRRAGVPRHGGGCQHHARAHHPCGRGSARHARAHAAFCRQVRRDLHARGLRAGAGDCAVHAAVHGLDLAAGHLQGAGAAGHCLPVRAGHLDARHGGERAGIGRAARHPDQGRHLPRRGAQAQGRGARQDGHHHRRQAEAGRVESARRFGQRGGGVCDCSEHRGPFGPPGVEGHRGGPEGRSRRGRRLHGAAGPRRAGHARGPELHARQPPADRREGPLYASARS
jgi:hypothetical protein